MASRKYHRKGKASKSKTHRRRRSSKHNKTVKKWWFGGNPVPNTVPHSGSAFSA